MPPEEDPLKPIPWTRMEELSEKVLLDAPDSLIMYGMVQTAQKWKHTAAADLIKLYTTDEEFENGAIVGIYNTVDKLSRIALYCFNEDTSSLRNALLTTGRLKWSVPDYAVFFTAIPEKLLSLVQECLPRLDFKVTVIANTIYHWKTPDQVSSCKYRCPPEVRLAPLGLESVELVRSKWFDSIWATEYITKLITHNKSMGVYSSSSGELCAFVLFSSFYTLTILHTMEEHRRKGYAQLLCNAISEQLLSEGVIVGATVEADNTPSLKLFQSLQFKSSPKRVFYVSGSKRKKP